MVRLPASHTGSAEGDPMSKVEIEFETLRVMYDAVRGSMDFGSGFLDSEDVKALREVAVIIGVDPMDATPETFARNYPHPWVRGYEDMGRIKCKTCRMAENYKMHDPFATESTLTEDSEA